MNKQFNPALLVIACLLAPAARAQEAKKIDDYIMGMNYDPKALLAVMSQGSTESIPGKSNGGKGIIICSQKKQSLNTDLSSVTILSPTTGVIYPGALLRANRNLAEGTPDAISLPRGPIQLSLDLPNLGDKGTVTVANPTNSSIQSAIQGIVAVWFKDARNGSGQASRQSYEVKKAFSSEQVALQLGFSAKWDKSNNLKLDAGFKHDGSSSTSVMLYKQVYYTASIDPPTDPAAVFAPSVTLADAKNRFNAQGPAAYVKSVDFGRLLMIRMDTSSSETEADLSAAMKYAVSGGKATIKADLKAKYESIVSNSTFTVISLGGNAEAVTSVMEGGTQAEANLLKVIQGSATFNRNNPAYPIAYTVNFLKDNRHATMAFSTNYTEWDCKEYPSGFVKLVQNGAYVGKFEVTWQETDPTGKTRVKKSWGSGNQSAGYTYTLNLPGDASNVNIKGMAATGLAWSPWGEAINVTENGPTNKTYTISGTTLNRKNSISAPAQ
jgi:thiol-activated cytolysin